MIAIYRKIEANTVLFGLICVLIATLGLSIKAILIKMVYQVNPGIDAVSILMLRFLFALPIFLIFMYFSGASHRAVSFSFDNVMALALLGAVGFYVPAILDFAALAYISASLERLILFLYPTFVVVFSIFLRPSEITRNIVMALLLSYAGIVVVFVGQAPYLDSQAVMGALMVFGAAVVFAVYTVLSVRQIHHFGPVMFTAFAMIAATVTTSIHAFYIHGFGVFVQGKKVYWLIFLMAVFSTALPLLLMAEGVKRLGASGTSIISTAGPPVTLVLAFVVLGEPFDMVQAVGSVLILTGVFFVSRAQPKK